MPVCFYSLLRHNRQGLSQGVPLMKLVKQGFVVATLGFALCAFAQDQKPASKETNLVIEDNDIYVPKDREASERTAELERFQKEFTFDWDNTNTIAPNKNIISEVNEFLKTIKDPTKLSPTDQRMLGNLYYKIGTYNGHVANQPEIAIDQLNAAATLLTTKDALTWCYGQLGYLYEQKYAKSRLATDRDQALYYTTKAIDQFPADAKNKAVAFAYAIRGLTFHESHDYAQAEMQLKIALALDESLPGGKDDQYTRTKNCLADTILEQNNRDKDAIALLEDVNKYWLSQKTFAQNPYAAKNLLSLGNAYLKTGNIPAAQASIKQAIAILEKVYGATSMQLAKPYEMLALTYKQAGNQKLADAYEQKAATLSKG